MELGTVAKLSHKEWRRRAKKERRRRLRTREARARDADAERLDRKLKESADYLNWLEARRAQEDLKARQEQEEHELQEQKWLEEEVRAQKDWRIQQDRKAKARQEQLDQEARIRKEYELKQEVLRKKKEEVRRREEEESKRFSDLQREIDAYIDEGTSTPESLRAVTNTQPGKDLCPFFSKTGACRYGDTCSRNHQRLALSKVLLVPGFYSHFSLEKNSAEYDTDIGLEFDGSETRHHFREFYNDVVPELESFGRIKTLRYCRNAEIHLRGNMYVEYYTEREAARALRSLKGRWYAGRQLNCEFANLKSWRNAVCGMPKCPKGRGCNFLHTFRNPRDEYDIKSPPRSRMRPGTSRADHSQISGSSRSSRIDQESTRSGGWHNQTSREDSARNWRWSESPDSGADSPSRLGRPEDRRRGRDDQKDSRRTRKRRRDSRKSRARGSDDDKTEERVEMELSNNGGRSPRRKRDKTPASKRRRGSEGDPKAKKKKKKKDKKKDRRDDDDEEHEAEGRSTKSLSEKNGEKLDSLPKISEKTESRTKWDDTNVTPDSEGEENVASTKRRRRGSARSRSRSWSEVDVGETSANLAPESTDGKRSRTPHR